MDLKPVIQRIRAEVPEARYVKFAMSLPAAMEDAAKQQRGHVWLYVLPAVETAGPNSTATVVTQLVSVEFGVLVVSKNVAQATGDGADDELHAVRGPLRDALIGWAPTGATAAIEARTGRLMGFNDFVSVWQDNFITQEMIRK